MSDETIPTSESDDSEAGDAISAFVAEDDAPEPARRETKPAKRETKPERRETSEREDEEDGGEEGGEDEDDEKPTEKVAAKPPEKRRYKVKVDGEDLEVDEDELQRGYARNRSVTQRSQKLARERQQIDEAKALAKKNPAKALELLGLSPDEYRQHAERMVWEELQAEIGADGKPLSEEQKRLRKLEADNRRLQEERQAEAERVKREEEERTAGETQRHWVKSIVSALEARKEPKWLLHRVAGHLAAAVDGDQGLDPADLMDDAIDLALEDLQAEHGRVFDAMEWPDLKSRFPKLVEKIRKGLVTDWKAGKNPKPEPTEAAPETRRRRERKDEHFTTHGDALRAFISGR